MIPVQCRVRHDPANGSYGDCLRACVASLLDIETPEDVPHFADGENTTGEETLARLDEWLSTKRKSRVQIPFDGSLSFEQLLTVMAANAPTAHYILWCSSGGGDHVVICRGGEKVHDPAWFPSPVTGPLANGQWQIMLFVDA